MLLLRKDSFRTSIRVIREVVFRLLGSQMRVAFRLGKLSRSEFRIVLNLHRVSEPSVGANEALSPVLFEELLLFLKQHFEITTLDDELPHTGKPQIILSFDDGYKDFVDVAAPLMRKYRVRCNHNVIPEALITGRPPLNILARDFVGKAPQRLVRALRIPGFTMDDRPGLAQRLSAFVKNRPQTEQRALAELLLPQFFDWGCFRPTAMMTVEEVRQLASEHEFGAHSWSHASMEFETEDFLRDDVRRCQDFFQREFRTSLNVYAFPNGSCSIGQPEVVEQEGIRHVLLVGEQFDVHPRRHARFTFHARSSAEMRFRAIGALRPIPI